MSLIILKLYLLSVICCLVIDISGAINSLKRLLCVILAALFRFPSLYNKGASVSVKPFDCSLCMSFWSGTVFLYINSALSIASVAACLFIACGARYTTGLIQWLYSLTDKMLYEANKFTEIK